LWQNVKEGQRTFSFFGENVMSFLPNVKGGGLVKVKAIALVLLVIFASAAMSFAVGIASNQGSEVDFTQSYSIVQIGNGTVVEPNGEIIDTPGGPG